MGRELSDSNLDNYERLLESREDITDPKLREIIRKELDILQNNADRD